jgi:predicted nuclease with RNAse H fold
VKVVGIDLAGNPKNDTGFCIMQITGDKKTVSTSILHSDAEIIEKLKKVAPDLTAIDAPLTFDGQARRCDDLLRDYGALPVTLRGMETLAKRGVKLAELMRESDIKFVETHAVSTAKILGLHAKNETVMQKNLINSGMEGSIMERMLCKDEVDAIFAAIAACLHLENKTTAVGDARGTIMIPKV